jgi:hypothetical protein
LLGLRGMLSQAELHLLRLRLDAGRMRQVERGVYRQHIPTGLIRLPDGRVVKDPDLQIQHGIALVFERFAHLGNAQRVLHSLREESLLLPRYQTSGLHAGQLVWKKPTESMIYDILHNPAYAGAFVYGRTGPRPGRRPGQRGQIKRPMEEWTVIVNLRLTVQNWFSAKMQTAFSAKGHRWGEATLPLVSPVTSLCAGGRDVAPGEGRSPYSLGGPSFRLSL